MIETARIEKCTKFRGISRIKSGHEDPAVCGQKMTAVVAEQ